MGTGSAVHEHRTTAPEGAGTTEIAPTAEPVAPPQDAERVQARLGRRIATVAVLALVVVVYVLQAALPVTAFTLPFDRSQQIRSLVPEGWAFFTKSPRIPDPTIYGLDSGGGWRTLTEGPQANPTRDSLLGLDRLSRSQGTTRYPARIQLVLAANPCPCGAGNGASCECSPLARRTYLNRLSGPLMDRIDLRVTLNPVGAADLVGEHGQAESSAEVLKRVIAAREAAARRWSGQDFTVNAGAPGRVLRSPPFRLPVSVTADLATRLDRGSLSARGYDRVLRIAWSIVDLDGRASPTRDDVSEALELRTGETG